MVAIEGVCLAFMLVVLSAYVILPRSGKLKTDGFFWSAFFTLLAVLADMIAWACETGPAPAPLQYSSNFLSLVLTSFITPAFGYYIHQMINEKHPFSRVYADAISAVNIAAVIVVVVAAFCGRLFDIHPADDNPAVMIYDVGGFFYEFPIILATLSLVFLFVLELRHAKYLGRQNIIVFSLYFLLPLLGSIAEVVTDEIQLSYAITSLSMSIVYVMVQSKHMNELLLREKLLKEISYMDQLTGLQNRRACDRDMVLIREDDSVSVVFCDLNGLKRINDQKGHHAGDEFLISFSKIITKYFPGEFIYRISGDEFLVVARNMAAGEFERSISELKREIDENAGIAALGTISGTGESISALIKKAELAMYDNKKEFYRRNPDYTR